MIGNTYCNTWKEELIGLFIGEFREQAKCSIPDAIFIRPSLIFVKAAGTSKATKATFEVIYQCPRRVCLFTRGAYARAETNIMVYRRVTLVRRVGKIGFLSRR